MSTPLARSLLAVLLLGSLLAARAERADRDKPLNAEADAMRHDDLKQVTVFSGNVLITKGTIVIRAARVEVSQTPDGYQRAQITAAPGQLAYYRSKRDGVDEYMEGQAEVIEYDGRSDTVQLLRRAVLRRYAGSVVADETTGSVIRYDNTAEVFTVDGAPGTGPAGRVRAMITPRAQAAVPAAPATPAPPSVPLRPSTSLGTDKR